METHSRAKVKHFLRRATRTTRRARTRVERDGAARVTPAMHEIRAQRRYHVRNARPTPRVVVKTRVHARRDSRDAYFVVDANGRPEIFRDAARNACTGAARDIARTRPRVRVSLRASSRALIARLIARSSRRVVSVTQRA